MIKIMVFYINPNKAGLFEGSFFLLTNYTVILSVRSLLSFGTPLNKDSYGESTALGNLVAVSFFLNFH